MSLAITRLHTGAWQVSAVIGGYREKRTYYYASRREAVAKFLAEFGGGV